MIPIYKPYLPKSSLKYAHDALDSGWISSQGRYISMVAERLQELLGVKYVLPVNNGTSACHLVAMATRHKFNCDEVIVPNGVYVAGVNAFLFSGDWKLFSVKCDLNTWNYDLDALDMAIISHPNACVLVLHNVGNILNVPALQIKYPNTIFIEDACEAFGGRYDDKPAGTSSFISAFSAFANKTVCAGEGGWCATSDEETYQFIKKTHCQGQTETRFVHDVLGFNYRISNIHAAVLLGQLDIIDEITEKKKEIFNTYRNALKNRDDVYFQHEMEGTQHANWLFGIKIPAQKNYDTAEKFFKKHQIETRQMFFPLSSHKHLQNNLNIHDVEDDNAATLNKSCLILPSFPDLTKNEQEFIIKTIMDYLNI